MSAITRMKCRAEASEIETFSVIGGNYSDDSQIERQVKSTGRRIVLIDNYDSFTFNLYQMLIGPLQCNVAVVRNDAVTWAELQKRSFDGVVLSPGPGNPTNQKDFGVCAAVLEHCRQPILGVCLGHQGIGAHYGARIRRAPEPYHGRVSEIEHHGGVLFEGLPRRFRIVRYHSLVVEEPLPAGLRPVAYTQDKLLMAVEALDRPVFGVQFHPESIATEYGTTVVGNFVRYCAQHTQPTADIKIDHSLTNAQLGKRFQ